MNPAATSGVTRAVIYARYSSEHQREASIEDQVRICTARIEAEGWTLVATYADYAQSGASHLRPGYQKLLADARRQPSTWWSRKRLIDCRVIRSTSQRCSST
jgi:DNA invertase Pin-like site-specific DNA recombinase